MAGTVEWREPPGRDRLGRRTVAGPRSHVYADLAQKLKDNPGRSALILTFPAEEEDKGRQVAVNINRHRYAAFRDPAFSAESHAEANALGERVLNVYAVYDPED